MRILREEPMSHLAKGERDVTSVIIGNMFSSGVEATKEQRQY